MPHVFDPRYNNLVLHVKHQAPGQSPIDRELTVRVTDGEGQVWLDPAVTPTIGTITQGRLVIASEDFPRFAPLSLSLTGTDLRFLVRRGLLLSFELVARQATSLRLHCTRLWTAAYRYRLRWSSEQNRVTVTRVNGVDDDRETSLHIHALKGNLEPSPGLEQDPKGMVTYGKLTLRPASDGELRLQMHGARMEWEFADSSLTGLRVFDSQGAIATLWMLDQSKAGITISAGLMDTVI